QIRAEESVEIMAEDEGTIIRGQLDVLILKEQFWVMAIESKRFSFSMEAGLAQLLAYMMANPHPTKPSLGLIVTGGTFVFVKLVKDAVAQYAISNEFAIRNQGNELYDAFSILKRIGNL
ncbi:MAG: restriction endonuclease subunit R, partial [Verrucomicrobia bacterium]|nr:restriction endonuclease subunit R [Leptolyngbya sp. ES-bin-22]